MAHQRKEASILWSHHEETRDTLPIPHPTRRLWRLDARAFGASIVVPADTKSGRRHWSPPVVK